MSEAAWGEVTITIGTSLSIMVGSKDRPGYDPSHRSSVQYLNVIDRINLTNTQP